mmetsp:Transcript_42583/g.65318  ORF Transcript_42583/g.65318 Transcript_42583/m.65318 type:complete len:88 (-) Transcript_42583:544-807(-)
MKRMSNESLSNPLLQDDINNIELSSCKLPNDSLIDQEFGADPRGSLPVGGAHLMKKLSLATDLSTVANKSAINQKMRLRNSVSKVSV